MSLICANFFSTLLYIGVAICVLLLMVLIHEFGHYIVGRLLGFKINEFSIGFGKAIFSKINKRGERISLRIFPLGGYCAFDGEEDEDEEDGSAKEEIENKDKSKEEVAEDSSEEKSPKVSNEKAQELIDEINNIKLAQNNDVVKQPKSLKFNEQKPWKRLLVYAAGVAFNFISAIIFSFILLVSYGYDTQQVASLDTNYSYLYGELQEGDVIRKVNGVEVDFAFTGTLTQLLKDPFMKDETLTTCTYQLTVDRGNQKNLNVQIKIDKVAEVVDGETVYKYNLGFATKSYVYSFWEALGRCFELAFGFAWVVLKSFGQIITGQVAFSELGGPISTIGMITTITQSGFVNFLILLPLLAANLAVFNFLPIPALDGCHAIFTLLEWIFKKPVVSRKVEGYIHFYGLLALLLLVVVADIVHIAVVGL